MPRRNVDILALLLTVCTSFGCGTTSLDEAEARAIVRPKFGSAFASLQHVDLFRLDGTYVATADASAGLEYELPPGTYLADFLASDGRHSLLPDGRLAFAPMGEGFTVVDGPILLDGHAAPLWRIEVDAALEANARLLRRLQEGDPTLTRWRPMLLPEREDPTTDEPGPRALSFSTTFASTSLGQRLRVTWELSFAMTGRFTTSSTDSTTCNNSTRCWTMGASGSTLAVYDADGDGVGYVDYDPDAWKRALAAYPSGLASCRDDTELYGGVTCAPQRGTSDPREYTCQGSCVSGSGPSATHPLGGECKFFGNLVLYRSGQYGAGSWKTLPRDCTIYNDTSSFPFATSSSIQVGTPLRAVLLKSGKTTCNGSNDTSLLHLTTVVAYDPTSNTALVVDSNWVGTKGTYVAEQIGAHVMSFGGTGLQNLSNYRDLGCVYGGGC